MAAAPSTGPRIDQVRAAAYTVSTPEPEADATLEWTSTTIVLAFVDAGDVHGVGWTYADPSAAELITGKLAVSVQGRPLLDVPAAWTAMQHSIRNLGRPGLVSCAMSAVDIAIWDAAARYLEQPVSRLLGRVHDQVEVYASGGFTTQSEEQLADQLRRWCVEQQIPRVKIKIGESWGTRAERDLARVALTRSVVGAGVEVYVDGNGGYSVGQARRIAHRLDEHGVSWFEEPVSSDDLDGLALLRHCCTADIAAGEYGYDLVYFTRMVPAVDCLQIDVTRCGGYTEWVRAAAVAAGWNREVSAHCAPNLSVHAAVATQNFRHIEWFVDHDRIEKELFDGSLDAYGGSVAPQSAPGHGLQFRPDAAAPYAV